MLAAEGVFALTLPLVIGPWSDTFKTPMGRRRPFMLAALGPMGFCLAILAFMPNIWTTTLIVLAFFFAYYVYEPPYRGLYPDVLHESMYGRSQGVQHVMRGIALGIALVGGGFLFHVWDPAPFLLAAVATTAACGACIFLVHELETRARACSAACATTCARAGTVFTRCRRCGGSCSRTRRGRGRSRRCGRSSSSTSRRALGSRSRPPRRVLATVAVGYVIAALGSGWLGDRFGLARVIFGASFVYGIGLLVAGLAQEWHSWYYGLILPVAAAGGTVMTLSWALLFKLMPAPHRGAISGLATTTKGIGLLVGPLVAGIMIDVMAPYLGRTHGYEILWPVCAIPVLAAIPLVASLIHIEPSGTAEPQPG